MIVLQRWAALIWIFPCENRCANHRTPPRDRSGYERSFRVDEAGSGNHGDELGDVTVRCKSVCDDDHAGGDFYGVLLLPQGRRRDAIEAAAIAMFEEDFAGRILPFSSLAAHAYAEIAAVRRQSGRPISQFDAQIAGIAKSTGASIATRNITDFDGCGIKVIDPWQL